MNLALHLNAWWIYRITEINLSHDSGLLQSTGWTIRDAAKRLGCHHSHLARIVRGERHSARLEKKLSELIENPT